MGPEGKKVVCPYCGYRMPIYAAKGAKCRGLWVRCKNKACKKELEIEIK